MSEYTPDLFAPQRPEQGIAEYLLALKGWLADADTARMRATSGEVYEHMWMAWTAWAVGNGVEIRAITPADLQAFLLSRGGSDDLSPRYALRMLRLINRVLASYARDRGFSPITAVSELVKARPDLRYANALKDQDLPEYLPASEARRVVAFLSAVRPGRGQTNGQWQEIRDRASVALMLGAGLTPGEVRALKVSDAVCAGGRVRDVPWKLNVESDGTSPARETPIAHWAGQLLRYWLDVRSEQGFPGQVMFPSTRASGKTWSKMSQYDAAKAVLASAGFEGADGGSFRLRHTFALRQLRRGKSPAEVARWLGISEGEVAARYLRVVAAPIDIS